MRKKSASTLPASQERWAGRPKQDKCPKSYAGTGPYLQCNFIFHQQSNFDIHEIEVILQLLIRTNKRDDLFSHLHKIKLLLKILVTLVEQVNKFSDHNHRRILSINWRREKYVSDKEQNSQKKFYVSWNISVVLKKQLYSHIRHLLIFWDVQRQPPSATLSVTPLPRMTVANTASNKTPSHRWAKGLKSRAAAHPQALPSGQEKSSVKNTQNPMAFNSSLLSHSYSLRVL